MLGTRSLAGRVPVSLSPADFCADLGNLCVTDDGGHTWTLAPLCCLRKAAL
jgi:hypothetical protein